MKAPDYFSFNYHENYHENLTLDNILIGDSLKNKANNKENQLSFKSYQTPKTTLPPIQTNKNNNSSYSNDFNKKIIDCWYL